MQSDKELTKEALIKLVTRLTVKALLNRGSIPVGVSNRHVHLNRADMDVLFGVGSELTPIKDLRQPGQFACAEQLTIRGPKGELKGVRVLGPLRNETQVEISVTDGFLLGIPAPVRESGHLDGTPGIELMGPRGTIKKKSGVIAALRHIHMTPQDAVRFGVSDEDIVSVDIGSGIRSATLHGVLVRVSDRYALEMHLDIDEANAVGAKNNDYVCIRRYEGDDGPKSEFCE